MKRNIHTKTSDSGFTINGYDWIIFALFAVYAAVFFLGRWGGEQPFISLGSDLAINVAGSAAALDHPQAFRGDPVLGNASNFQFYMSAQIPLTRLLVRTGLDYGTAVLIPLGLLVLLHLAGYYFLGRVLFKSRFWGFLLAVLTIFTVVLTNGEFWGVYGDPYPRFAFQGLLPFILGAVILGREKTEVWLAVMAALGLAIYIHAISALTWAVPIWLSFWFVVPKTWSWKRAWGVIVSAGLLFLAVSFPFWWNYLGSTSEVVLDYQETVRFIKTIFPYFFYPFSDFQFFVDILYRDGLLVPGLIGLVLTCLYPSERKTLKIFGIWTAGLLFAALIVPWLEILWREGMGQLPALPILVRGERYLVLFIEIFWLYPLALIDRNLVRSGIVMWRVPFLKQVASVLDRKALRAGTVLFGILAVCLAGVLTDNGYQSGRAHQWKYPLHAIQCWRNGHLVCSESMDVQPTTEMLTFIRNDISNEKTILPFLFNNGGSYPYDLAIRYFGLHPVVYTAKDFSSLWHSVPDELLAWEKTNIEISAIQGIISPEERLAAGMALAERLGADYLVVDWKDLPKSKEPGRIAFQNNIYRIISVENKAE